MKQREVELKSRVSQLEREVDRLKRMILLLTKQVRESKSDSSVSSNR